MFDATTYKWPTPKRLVLSLLSSPDLAEISVRQCLHWGELFEIDPTAMRVALGRLVKAGFLRSVARGRYAIGDRGEVLSKTARQWVSAEERVGSWDGRWLMAHTAHLGRRDKTVLKVREHALELVGFAGLYPGLWCRPANYLETPADTRERLLELGLEKEAVILRVDVLLGDKASVTELWPQRALEERYKTLTRAMLDSIGRGDSQDGEALVRETFLLGEAVIRQIASDPLLPDTMIDVKARRKMHETMVAYDAFGRRAWTHFQNHTS
ncbi:PaaX [Congregibacter sp.]|uniref:PaaX n=1 Tax=Congregibacter sp. TaxID=2744308 RepID=UPI003F6C65B6